LFDEFVALSKKFTSALVAGDQQAMTGLYESGFPLGDQLLDQLAELRSMVLFTAEQKSEEVEGEVNHTIGVTAAASVGALLLFMCALVLAIRNISRPLVTLEQAVTAIRHGNLTYPVRSERKDELGSLANCIGDMVDEISEHNKMEAILDNLDSMICAIDFDYNLLFVNKRMADTFGLDREKCVGQKCYQSKKKLDHPCSICRLPALLQRKDSLPTVEYEMWDSVLNEWIGGTDSIIRWVDGSMAFFQSQRDVTQKKQQEKLLQEALQAAEAASLTKSSFLANMSHEIRTPMNAILGITGILLEKDTLSPDDREGLNKINNSADLLLGLINDILDLSKIEAGKLDLMPEKYEVASVLSDTVQLNLMRLESKTLEFMLDVDENIPAMLFGDSLRIKQILNNLLSNAFKYTDSGEITLTVTAEFGVREEPDVTLVFRVRDTGPGMTEEQVGRLFEEYTRFMEARRTTVGTGLGMPITRNLVHLMHGELLVESEPGRGSTFTARLPQGSVGAGAIGREVAENLRYFRMDQGQQLRGAQIVREPMPYGSVLVVDDVETNLYVAKGLMRSYQLQIDTAMNGVEAVGKIRGGKEYDVIFMDHMMPQMDGMEATQIIRGLGYARPIVALTANAVMGQAEVFLANGFDGFISKPIDLRQLNATLNKLVRDKQPPEVLEAARRQHDFAQDDDAGKGAGQTRLDPQLAESFLRDAAKAVLVLEVTFENGELGKGENLDMYILKVHAMKSALANIGEAGLSAYAFRLEQAGRSGNLAVIKAETPAFVDALRAVIETIKPEEEDKHSEGRDGDQAYLRERLLAIQAACKAYDIGAAEEALAELRQKTWPQRSKDLLSAIGVQLLHSDLDEAARIAEEYAGREE
jgi:PAS domain S-box-containing protein